MNELNYFSKVLRPKSERRKAEGELNRVAQDLNRIYFGGLINVPPIRLLASLTRAGGYYHLASPKRRDWISISTHTRFPLSVLMHELAHAYQYQRRLGRSHDKSFQELEHKLPCPPRLFNESIMIRCEEQIRKDLEDK